MAKQLNFSSWAMQPVLNSEATDVVKILRFSCNEYILKNGEIAPMSKYTKANFLFLIIFVLTFALFSYFMGFWPWIFASIGIALSLRQCYLNSSGDVFVSAFIFGGLTLFYMSRVDWDTLLPILMTLSIFYLLIKEYFLYQHNRNSNKNP